MENLKNLIEKAGYSVTIVNQHKVEAYKEGIFIDSSSCLQVLSIKLGL